MKLPTTLLTLAIGFGLTLPMAPHAEASFGNIQRCRAADGTAVYTDKPCAAFNATPEAMPSELGLRLASEAMREPRDVDAAASDIVASAGAVSSRRSLLDGCARTPTQLAMDIEGSIALGDVNRLAESWQWAGMSHRQAMPLMARLERLTRGRAASAQFVDAQMGFGLQVASAAGGADGRAGLMEVQLAGEDGMQSVQLNVERYAGCYFVRF